MQRRIANRICPKTLPPKNGKLKDPKTDGHPGSLRNSGMSLSPIQNSKKQRQFASNGAQSHAVKCDFH